MVDETIHRVVESLSSVDESPELFRPSRQGVQMPSIDALQEVVSFLRRIFYPGFFAHSEVTTDTMRYYIGANVDKVFRALTEQVRRGFCFPCDTTGDGSCSTCGEDAESVVRRFLERLPAVRDRLATDARAAYEGDPAARSVGETIFCYPSIRALTNYRIAHELHTLGVPLIPRIITEMAHSETGIDIHPGAVIGSHCFIDHGTGVVIGETCVIGNRVRIYQGVTLGAKSFPLDADGNPIKGIPRHPIIEDDVTIYSGTTILGRITIGAGSVIGGNLWVTKDVPPGTRLAQSRYESHSLQDGAGI